MLNAVLGFVVAIGVLVTVHEFGHYWVARRLGVKVLRFSVGFGRPLLTWRAGRDDIEYCIGAVPLGGYVKMLDESEGDVAPHERHRAFNRQRLGVRIAVVVAGPMFNFLFAVVAYWAMFMLGIAGLKPIVGDVAPGSAAARAGLHGGQEIVAVHGWETRTWQGVIEAVLGAALEGRALPLDVRDRDGRAARVDLDLAGIGMDDLTRGRFFDSVGIEPEQPAIPPVLDEVTSDGAGAAAGLRTGDRVLTVDGEPIGDWREFVDVVRASPGVRLRTTLERDGAKVAVDLVPAPIESEEGTIGRIGVGPRSPEGLLRDYYATERYPPLDAFARAAVKTWDTTLLTLRMLWKMVLLEVSVRNLSGPISIAQYAGVSAELGPARFLNFLAIVSISLGILNLLPIPLLDGGHLLYYCMELVRGRPVSEDVQFLGQRLGIVMLVGLMGLAFYNDLARIFG